MCQKVGSKALTPIGSSGFLVGGCLRSPLVDYVNVTVNRGDAPTQQAAGAYGTGHIPTSGFLCFWPSNSS